MADPAPPVIRDVLDHAWDVAQRLAIEVIEYPADKRDQVMQCMGSLLVEGGTPRRLPTWGSARVWRRNGADHSRYVSEIEASGGGTVGTA